jgi:hypothetical protein
MQNHNSKVKSVESLRDNAVYAGGRGSEGGGRMTEDGGRMTEDRGQRAEKR